MSRNPFEEINKFDPNHLNQFDIVETYITNSINLNTTLSDNFLTPKEQGKKNTGSLLAFLYSKNGIPLIIVGPNWKFLIFSSVFFLLNTMLFQYYMWIKLTNIVKYTGLIFNSISIISFIITSISNPGIANDNMEVDAEDVFHKIKDYKICSICQAVININKNTHHCFECGVCIDGFDHHCPWISKCIGKGNYKSFYLFISSFFALCSFYITGGLYILQN